MICYVEVTLPGPWWNKLTYSFSVPPKAGARVIIPVGRSKRVGFVDRIGDKASWNDGKIKPIVAVLDDEVIFPEPFWNMIDWAGKVFFCGSGEVLKALLPKEILSGDPISPFKGNLQVQRERKKETIQTFYRWSDPERYGHYIDLIDGLRGQAIFSFPEQNKAKNFFAFLEEKGISALLWPSSGGKKLIKNWLQFRDGEVKIVVGGPGVASAIANDLELMVIDEEGSESYRSQRYPYVNLRSILARTAREYGAKLVLGGMIPSSRVFKSCVPEEVKRRPGNRLVFANIYEDNKVDLPGIKWDIPIAHVSMRETLKTIKDGKVALWLLDRKGYAGDLHCQDCGESILCHCGGRFKLERGKMICLKCGHIEPVPLQCPHCRSNVLSCKSPGLEALSEVAKTVVSYEDQVYLWQVGDPKGIKDKRERLKLISKGALVVGTRRALELCDLVDVGCVCWIDGDAEARRTDIGARYTAYRMMAESCWRGSDSQNRSVVVQSRRPGKGWQATLTSGWSVFWSRELQEREEFELPPFRYLLEISDLGDLKESLCDEFFDHGIDIMDPDPDKDVLWASVRKLSIIRDLLSQYYKIGFSRRYPKITVWMD